jgi:hypothetical protein
MKNALFEKMEDESNQFNPEERVPVFGSPYQ